jgi:hypothetical protein
MVPNRKLVPYIESFKRFQVKNVLAPMHKVDNLFKYMINVY